MNEIVPKKERFEKELQEIESLQNDKDEPIVLKSFETQTGLFDLFKKRVTGEEMNEYSLYLGNTLNEFNKKINKFYLQFKGVYGALESLDKEYLAGIVGAYNEAVQAFKKAEKAQGDVDRTLEYLKEAVNKIGEFNKKVNSELARMDSKNWKQDALDYQAKMDEIGAKSELIIQTMTRYEEDHSSLMAKLDSCEKELEKCRKEKSKARKALIACIAVSGVALVAIAVIAILIGLGVL